MKDKTVFYISLIIVIVLALYLAWITVPLFYKYFSKDTGQNVENKEEVSQKEVVVEDKKPSIFSRFFNRSRPRLVGNRASENGFFVLGKGNTEKSTNVNNSEVGVSSDGLKTTQEGSSNNSGKVSLTSFVNQEIKGEDFKYRDNVVLAGNFKNNSREDISVDFEGRIYRVSELLKFPNIEKDIPLSTVSIKENFASDENKEVVYEHKIKECGNYYMAIAEKPYWTNGSSDVTFAYFASPCSADFNNNDIANADLDLNTGSVENNFVANTEENSGKAVVKQLPKAGVKEWAGVIGFVMLLSVVIFRGKILNN